MIKIIPDPSTFKIIRAEYENNCFNKTVEVKVLTFKNDTDPNNAGTIFEKYRSLITGAEEYFEENRSTLETFVAKYSLCFDNFSPDYIICLFPADKNRKEILKKFKDKVTSCYQSSIIDYSEKFVKKDPSKSIKKDNLAKDDFELSVDQQTPFKGLLIIDDAIDEGKTLNILLDKLIDKKLIDINTELKMACIYNRAKTAKPQTDPMQAYRDRTNSDKESPATNNK